MNILSTIGSFFENIFFFFRFFENLQKFLDNEGFNIDLAKCTNNKEIEDFVLNDRIDGVKKFKINATPTVIINNEKFEKPLNFKNLKKALEKLI